MSGEETEENRPPFLFIPSVEAGDLLENRETFANVLLPFVAHCLGRGGEYPEPENVAERAVYRSMIAAADRQAKKYADKCRKNRENAGKRWNQKTAQPSAPVAVDRGTGGKPDTSNRHPSNAPQGAPVRREIAPQGAGTSNKPATVPAKPSAPVAPGRRIIEPARDKRTGGARAFADCIGDIAARFGRDGAGVSIEDKIAGEPVAAALEITGETGNARAVNTFKKLLRTKGEGAFSDELFAFYSELKQGETPDNYGAALVSRLSKLPDVPAEG